MNPLPLDTSSLRLRRIVAGDAARMMELNAEVSTRRWLPSHVYADIAEARSRLQYLIGCYASPGDPRLGPYVLAVEHRAGGALLGHVGFSPYHADVEVSYAIAEASRGQGYGAEALHRACQWAAAEWDLPTFIAITEVENAPSRRTLARAAFVHADDQLMEFQGRPEWVSRYVWRRSEATPV